MTEHTPTPELRMSAYYYSFDRTGTLAVDRVLSAVAVAGKGCHNTEDWDDYGYVDKIQEAAAAADADFKALVEALDTLVILFGRTGDDFQDFEEQAAAFQKDTGKMRPGKDVPALAPHLGSTREEYRTWMNNKVSTARAVLLQVGIAS